MKTFILKDEFKASEIRPSEDFNRYLKLLDEDVSDILKDGAGYYIRACPACECSESKVAFNKGRFQYQACCSCQSIYINPRPDNAIMHDFLKRSKAVELWLSSKLQESASRKQHVFRPRVNWIRGYVGLGYDAAPELSLLDYEAKYGYLIEELRKAKIFDSISYLRPREEVLLHKGGKDNLVVEDDDESRFDVITAFEVLDRTVDLQATVANLVKRLNPNGLLFITTISASGFDLRILKERARSIVAPIHQNILSVEGVKTLLQGAGLELLEMSSPGSIDLSIIEQALAEGNDIEIPDYLRDILFKRGDDVKAMFQEFLQYALMSSHLRVVARKRPDEGEDKQ